MSAKNNSFKARSKDSLQRKKGKRQDFSEKREKFIVFSFKDFDRNQGQSFKEWEEEELLALAVSKISQLSNLTMSQAIQQTILKVYTKVEFPPKSDFKHPKHVKDGVKWASFHVQGKECIIGYVEENVFYIVFLDKDHKFWKTEKKNT
jgi:hypothetical protein